MERVPIAEAELTSLRATGAAVNADPAVVAAYSRDNAAPAAVGTALAVAFPETTGQVRAVMRWASATGTPVVVRGAGTGLAGASSAVDGALMLSTSRMTGVRVDPANLLAAAQPGTVTAAVERAAAAHGLMYAPDPSSIESCSIGGNVATNAGGLRCVKYGVTRESVAALEVVLADGEVLRTGKRTVKNVSGYDLTSLFVGSEGTLGVITGVQLRLRPRPRGPQAVVAGYFGDAAAAAETAHRVVLAGLDPTLLELMDRPTLESLEEWKSLGLPAAAGAMLIAQFIGQDAGRRAADAEKLCRDRGFDIVTGDTEAEAEQLIA
jgi:glycolate oxidase